MISKMDLKNKCNNELDQPKENSNVVTLRKLLYATENIISNRNYDSNTTAHPFIDEQSSMCVLMNVDRSNQSYKSSILNTKNILTNCPLGSSTPTSHLDFKNQFLNKNKIIKSDIGEQLRSPLLKYKNNETLEISNNFDEAKLPNGNFSTSEPVVSLDSEITLDHKVENINNLECPIENIYWRENEQNTYCYLNNTTFLISNNSSVKEKSDCSQRHVNKVINYYENKEEFKGNKMSLYLSNNRNDIMQCNIINTMKSFQNDNLERHLSYNSSSDSEEVISASITHGMEKSDCAQPILKLGKLITNNKFKTVNSTKLKHNVDDIKEISSLGDNLSPNYMKYEQSNNLKRHSSNDSKPLLCIMHNSVQHSNENDTNSFIHLESDPMGSGAFDKNINVWLNKIQPKNYNVKTPKKEYNILREKSINDTNCNDLLPKKFNNKPTLPLKKKNLYGISANSTKSISKNKNTIKKNRHLLKEIKQTEIKHVTGKINPKPNYRVLQSNDHQDVKSKIINKDEIIEQILQSVPYNSDGEDIVDKLTVNKKSLQSLKVLEKDKDNKKIPMKFNSRKELLKTKGSLLKCISRELQISSSDSETTSNNYKTRQLKKKCSVLNNVCEETNKQKPLKMVSPIYTTSSDSEIDDYNIERKVPIFSKGEKKYPVETSTQQMKTHSTTLDSSTEDIDTYLKKLLREKNKRLTNRKLHTDYSILTKQSATKPIKRHKYSKTLLHDTKKFKKKKTYCDVKKLKHPTSSESLSDTDIDIDLVTVKTKK